MNDEKKSLEEEIEKMKKICVACYERVPNMANKRCGHVALCRTCA